MKKSLVLLITMLTLLMLIACNMGLTPMDKEDGNVNYYIYPYIQFRPSEDGSYYIASVVSGAQLEKISIPGEIHTSNGTRPIKEFAGFASIYDAQALKVLSIDKNVTVIDGALDSVASLERIVVTGRKDGDVWGPLPILKKVGYHFLGWKSGDNYIKEGDMIDPEHSNAVPVFEVHSLEKIEGYPATCTTSGQKTYYKCSLCHELYLDPEGLTSVTLEGVTIPAYGHDLTYHEEKPSTCTDSGIRSYYDCSRCKLLFSDKDGKSQITDTILPAKGHSLRHVDAKEATCQIKGVIEHYHCDSCNKNFEDNEGKTELDHVEIGPINHESNEDWSRNNEYHWKKCKWCSNEFDKKKHDFDDGVVTLIPCEKEKGSILYTCNTCGYTKTVDIPEHDHKTGKIEVISPTCFEPGYTLDTCAICGTVIKTKEVPALEHKGTSYQYKEATCMSEGHIAYYHCDICGYNFASQSSKEILDNVGLKKEAHKAGTKYEFDGKEHWNLCIYNCGTKLNKVSHTFDQKNTSAQYQISAATCTKPASYHFSCICDQDGTEIFTIGEPSGHSLTYHARVESTCKEQGNIEYWSCSKCGKLFSDNECNIEITLDQTKLELANHTWSDGYQVDSEGHWQVCTVCAAQNTKVPHDIKYVADNEYHWKACIVCGYQKTSKEKHSFVIQGNTWYCTVCGKTAERTDSEPGFDVDPVYPAPSGKLSSSYDESGNKWTFEVVSTNPNSVPTNFTWYVDQVLQEGEQNEVFEFVPPSQNGYNVMCIFWNDSGYGSASETIN